MKQCVTFSPKKRGNLEKMKNRRRPDGRRWFIGAAWDDTHINRLNRLCLSQKMYCATLRLC